MKTARNNIMEPAVALALAIAAGHTLAQSTPGDAATSSGSSARTIGIEEIVVMAQRRSESLQDVPVAITAMTPETLEKFQILDIQGIKAQMPSLVFDKGVAFAQAFIRGVGTPFANPGLEPSISTFIDGAYVSRQFATQFELLDVETVQVLKGPQGTLWGRNASGGVVLINSADPELDSTYGRVRAEYGNYNHTLTEGMLNVPVSDTLGLRFAGRFTDDDGHLDNLTTGKDYGGSESYALRGKARYEPSDNFTAALTIDYSDKEFEFPTRAVGPVETCVACQLTGVTPVKVDGDDVRADVVPPWFGRNFGTNLTLDFSEENFNIKSVTAYRDVDGHAYADQDGESIPLFIFDSALGGSTYSQDITVTTDFGSKVDVTTGVSYMYDDGYAQSTFRGDAFAAGVPVFGHFPGMDNTVETESYSGFAELYYRPVENLTLTAGGRYTSDKREFHGSVNPYAQVAFGSPTPEWQLKEDFEAFTPRFVAAYDFGQMNVYVSYNEGFKAGGYNNPVFAPADPVDAETNSSYEAGIKFNAMESRLVGSLAVFDYENEDLQVAFVDLEAGGQSIVNAATSEGLGFEAELKFQVVPQLQLSGGFTYLDTEFTDYKTANGAAYGPNGELVSVNFDATGVRLPRAPKWAGFVAAESEFDLADGWLLSINGNARYSADYDFSVGSGGPVGTDRQDDLWLIDGSANIGPASGPFKVGAYVNNLTDEKYTLSIGAAPPFAILDAPAIGRTYGLRVSYDF